MIEIFGSAATALDNFLAVGEIVSAGLFALVAIRIRGGVYRFALLQIFALAANISATRSMLAMTGCAVIFVNAASAVYVLNKIEWTTFAPHSGRQYVRVLGPWMIGIAGTIEAYLRAYL